ncbi:hypothetical protein TTHERM_00293290 (macronuclear) [Tetrahymena thermophila SB210]|uniref:BRCT domain-containing protein n=1 Tax=Tetrahymena thermophila (strain SB210) TaxID=312017 RepID=I7M0W1_TETTS|nr:hypothetical protein TTHERM_00293290 [Tetrahymena thermophila SB210]EAR92816.1 hypothetical protein TTHERM_00293290 [Tetrahymena thermophila SB210]|eukprot:XP_001013061.1 hypothetical protein TTHERM_00293290 [Tetrahymena thermophila SB210]
MFKEDKSKSKVHSEFQVELVVYLDEEDQIKEVFELNIGNNVVGSSSKDSTIVINKPEIEKKHFQIEIEYDQKMNTLLCQIQSLKSEHGTQKKLKDGNFTGFLPGKWNPIGDLSKEYAFYIAKKYKALVRKVAKNIKSSRSIEASSNQNSNPNPINKINFLKSLDNLDAGEINKENNQMETKSDIVVQNNISAQDNSATKPKMFGKNFKPKNSSIDANKNLHSKFKTPTVSTEKQPDVAQKMEVEKTDKKNSDKKNENKLDSGPIVTLKVPSSPQVKSSKSKETDQNKSKLKETKQANQVAEAKQTDETNAKQNNEAQGKQKGKSRKNQNKKKDSSDLDLSLDLSLDMSDEDKKQKNAKQQMIDEKEVIKIASTDDEDEEDRALQKKQANKNQMNKEVESTTKADTKTTAKSSNKEKQPNKRNTSKDNKQQSDDEKQQKTSLLNKKRKADENKESKLMDIEEEQEHAENSKKDIQTKSIKENAQKKGSLKPTLAQNAVGIKKRKTDEADEEKDNKKVQATTVMKDETQKMKDKKEEKQKDKKQNDNDNVMEDENQLKKNLKNKQMAQAKQKDDNNQKPKKEMSKIESSKEQKKGSKEVTTKSAKTSLAATKKADKKKQVLKNQEKRNSLVKQNIENEQEDSEDELSYVINSDGEEEFVLKGNKNSIKSAIKPSNKKFNVIFSNCMLDETDVQNKLSKLGARIMKSIQQPFNILIMDQFTRRAKTLVALNKGAKIISSQWALDCVCQEHLIEDIDKYEIKVDKAFCKKHKFDLKEVQQRYQNQNKPIFQDVKFILPDDENYANIAKDDLEYIIMTAGGTIVTEEECDEIEDKSNIKVIFDNEKSDESHTTPEKNSSKSKLSDSKKKNQDETRIKLQYSYKKNNFDCVLIESIFNSCLHQKVCNWNDYQV